MILKLIKITRELVINLALQYRMAAVLAQEIAPIKHLGIGLKCPEIPPATILTDRKIQIRKVDHKMLLKATL